MPSEACTVVSVFPWQTIENKTGLINGRHVIPAAQPGQFIVYHVEDSYYMQNQVGTKRKIKVPVLSVDIARSIVEDFCNSHIHSTAEAKPGMFWVPGRLSKAAIIAEYKDQLEKAKKEQELWFIELVKNADDDWARYRQHKMITDIQRYAAKHLKLDREWLIDYTANSSLVLCEACQSNISNVAVKCPHCGYIRNKQKAAEMGLIEGKPAGK